MIVYLPKGFDYNDGTLSAIGIGENNISTDLSDKVSIPMVATPISSPVAIFSNVWNSRISPRTLY